MSSRLSALATIVASMFLCPCRAQSADLTPAAIDHLIRAEWKKAGITPSPPADDARFLRRLYIDITGVIPPPEAVRSFLADRSPGKRSTVVDALLAGPRYAEHWTNYWDRALMGRPARSQLVDSAEWRSWLRRRLEANTPYNRFVYDLLTAAGQNSPGGRYARALGLGRPSAPLPDSGAMNGAVNWFLKYAQTPADLAGQVSKVFLGVQIQCAQCHDHKTEKWKQEDFRRFAACFAQVRPIPIDRGKVMGIRRVELRDVGRGPLRLARPRMAEFSSSKPSALDGTDLSTAGSPRVALAAWITARENPWFAQAIVNRIWAHLLGRGFVEPINDFRESNPPVMPGLLHMLARDFVSHGYDLKQLIRTICATQAYQLSCGPAKGTDAENRLWARFRLKPLGPEELVDSLVAAANLGPVIHRIAGANAEALRFAMQRQFTFLFDVDEEFDEKEFEGTIPQALMLLNGQLVGRASSLIPGTAVADVVLAAGDDAARIETLYLRALSRLPTRAELARGRAFLSEPRSSTKVEDSASVPAPLGRPPRGMRRGAGPDPMSRLPGALAPRAASGPEQAYEDLFWALLNSSEFLFNH